MLILDLTLYNVKKKSQLRLPTRNMVLKKKIQNGYCVTENFYKYIVRFCETGNNIKTWW